MVKKERRWRWGALRAVTSKENISVCPQMTQMDTEKKLSVIREW